MADRGEQVRSQVRGAIVEELTARLLARRVGTAAVHRERRILFDGVRAEIHPYDVTVERDGSAEAYDCKWGARGINADVLHQLDDARTHAADEDEPLRVALVILDARRSCEVRLGRQTAPHDATGLITLETLDELSLGPMTVREPDRLLRAVPRPLRRGGAGRAAPDVGPPALRPGPGLVPLVGARLRARLVRGARHHLAGPAAEVAVVAPVRVGSELVGTTRVIGARRVWARRRTDFVDADGAAAAVVTIDWVLLDARGLPTRIPAEFEPVFGTTHTAIELGRVELGAAPAEAAQAALTVRPQELDPMDHVNNAVYADWLEERVIAAGGRAAVRADPARGTSRLCPRGRGRRDRRGDDVAGSRWSVVMPHRRCRRRGPAARPAGGGTDQVGHARPERPDAGPDVL